MPGTSLVTAPVPEPHRSTETVNDPSKLAATDFAESIVTEHEPVPEHAPLHPEKAEPVEGVAVNSTTVPPEYVSVQSDPQSIPPGLLVTVPAPVPTLETERVASVDAPDVLS